ncbi:MAG TPA: FAD-dependent oxidoreductase [Terriglobales bacterium]|jgi:ferredoxin--NADP+ reductase|nr:FAD-dependent oxidoreductase [Terriglobales bacterium]
MKTVFVVGAGPAGMFAAQKIALAGHQVVIFNRDIKHGGLAEYGIYLVKDKMKSGLRKQFAKVLSLPNVHYFGHAPVGATQKITVDDLRAFNPDAIVFSVGAQGTKKLGLPGEDAKGVYSAKDFVYFYNQLPPFARQDFSIGKKIAIVGMGNVMVDIARWVLLDCPDRKTEELTIVARRGPFEAKFDEKEIKYLEANLDRELLKAELQRVAAKVASVGQDISKADEIFTVLKKTDPQTTPVMKFRFLCSPKEIVKGPDGRICKLIVTENNLVKKGEGTAAKATDQTAELDLDTMIFAIGDVHDPNLGLPMGPEGYSTKPKEGDERSLYQVADPVTGAEMDGHFVVGWARRASDGLVGIARHDAEVGATHVLQYLEGKQDKRGAAVETIESTLRARGIQLVNKAELALLGKAEEKEAQARNLTYFKYSDDTSMLRAITREKNSTNTPAMAGAD